MSDIIGDKKIEIGIGLFLLVSVGVFLIIPVVWGADTIILVNPSTDTQVTNLTSSNSAIGLNASSGNILITPEWKLLCNTSGTGVNVTCSFTPTTFLDVRIIVISGSGGTAINPSLVFNNDLNGNYASRNSVNGGADTTNAGTNNCRVSGLTIGDNGGGIMLFRGMNIETQRKLMIGESTYGIDSTSATAPTKNESSCKWSNTTDQISSITLFKATGTNNFTSGTQITVWGYN